MISLFKLKPYEARPLNGYLKLKEPLVDIMAWTADHVRSQFHAFRKQSSLRCEANASRFDARHCEQCRAF